MSCNGWILIHLLADFTQLAKLSDIFEKILNGDSALPFEEPIVIRKRRSFSIVTQVIVLFTDWDQLLGNVDI